MLVNLHVKNLAIIDEVEVDFSDRLNVLTGETGAGKSIIIGSINLALGQKSPKDVIRKGADYALVELTFRADTERQRALVEEMLVLGVNSFFSLTNVASMSQITNFVITLNPPIHK